MYVLLLLYFVSLLCDRSLRSLAQAFSVKEEKTFNPQDVVCPYLLSSLSLSFHIPHKITMTVIHCTLQHTPHDLPHKYIQLTPLILHHIAHRPRHLISICAPALRTMRTSAHHHAHTLPYHHIYPPLYSTTPRHLSISA